MFQSNSLGGFRPFYLINNFYFGIMEVIDLKGELEIISMLHHYGITVGGIQFLGDCVDIVINERYLNSKVLSHLAEHQVYRLQSFDDGFGGGFRIRLRRPA